MTLKNEEREVLIKYRLDQAKDTEKLVDLLLQIMSYQQQSIEFINIVIFVFNYLKHFNFNNKTVVWQIFLN